MDSYTRLSVRPENNYDASYWWVSIRRQFHDRVSTTIPAMRVVVGVLCKTDRVDDRWTESGGCGIRSKPPRRSEKRGSPKTPAGSRDRECRIIWTTSLSFGQCCNDVDNLLTVICGNTNMPASNVALDIAGNHGELTLPTNDDLVSLN